MKKNSLRLRIMDDKDGQYFKALITHPMEAGDRRDIKTGEWVAADYIENLVVSVDDTPCFNIHFGQNVSRNPFFAFRLAKPVSDGQKLTIRWHENNQRQTTYDCTVEIDTNGRFNYHSKQYEVEVPPSALSKPACKTRLMQQ